MGEEAEEERDARGTQEKCGKQEHHHLRRERQEDGRSRRASHPLDEELLAPFMDPSPQECRDDRTERDETEEDERSRESPRRCTLRERPLEFAFPRRRCRE